jgi:hypothetical protein
MGAVLLWPRAKVKKNGDRSLALIDQGLSDVALAQ